MTLRDGTDEEGVRAEAAMKGSEGFLGVWSLFLTQLFFSSGRG